MDDAGFYEDVKIALYDNIVVIKQWDDHLNRYQEVTMSPEMFRDLLLAMDRPEGLFVFKAKE